MVEIRGGGSEGGVGSTDPTTFLKNISFLFKKICTDFIKKRKFDPTKNITSQK